MEYSWTKLTPSGTGRSKASLWPQSSVAQYSSSSTITRFPASCTRSDPSQPLVECSWKRTSSPLFYFSVKVSWPGSPSAAWRTLATRKKEIPPTHAKSMTYSMRISKTFHLLAKYVSSTQCWMSPQYLSWQSLSETISCKSCLLSAGSANGTAAHSFLM